MACGREDEVRWPEARTTFTVVYVAISTCALAEQLGYKGLEVVASVVSDGQVRFTIQGQPK